MLFLFYIWPKNWELSAAALIVFTAIWASELNKYYFEYLIDWQVVRLISVSLVLVFWMYAFLIGWKSTFAKDRALSNDPEVVQEAIKPVREVRTK
jgi:hypothetical protein